MAEIHNIDIAGHREDELLSRYMDGEATSEEVTSVEARLETDKAFAARLDIFKHNDALLKSSHASRGMDVPPGLAARLACEQAPSVKTKGFRTPAFALAASLTMAIGLGLALQLAGTDTDSTPRMDRALASALETKPSRAEGWDRLADGRELRAVLTFPAADGNWCREFMLATQDSHWRGVACREANTWVTQVIGREVFLDRETGYRPAGANDNDSVARFIDNTAADVALSRKQELNVIASGWQP